MIVSRPKSQAIFSLSVFQAISYGIMMYLLQGFHGALYEYLLLFLLGPLTVSVTIKMLWGLKTAKLGKEQLMVRYPFRFSKKVYQLKRDLQGWKETTVKASGRPFRELSLVFDRGKKVKFTDQENTEYERMLKYIRQKFPQRKMVD